MNHFSKPSDHHPLNKSLPPISSKNKKIVNIIIIIFFFATDHQTVAKGVLALGFWFVYGKNLKTKEEEREVFVGTHFEVELS